MEYDRALISSALRDRLRLKACTHPIQVAAWDSWLMHTMGRPVTAFKVRADRPPMRVWIMPFDAPPRPDTDDHDAAVAFFKRLRLRT